jgi:hypothetical protein
MPDYSGSFSGSFQGTISGSLLGSGILSSSTQIDFTSIPNKPAQNQYITPFQSNQIRALTEFKQGSVLTPGTFPYFSASMQDRVVSVSQNVTTLSSSILTTVSNLSSSIASRMTAIELDVDVTGSDAQNLSFNSSTYALSISNGNSVDLSSLAGGGSGGSGLAITASYTGSVLSQNIRSIDFTGSGVSVTNVGNAITVLVTRADSVSNAATASYISPTFISASVAAAGFGGGSDAALSQSTNPLTTFDGNRVVSNTSLPAGIYNTNFGTSGSLANFIEKVFFPNSVPVITTTGFTIQEFEASGSVVGTVSATDAEAQSITFRTSSLYTANYFRISSAGQITLNTKSTSSMNTDSTPGSGSHPFLVEAVDTFNGVGSQTIYIRVNPNTAPVWRQTSTNGSIITSYTASLNENSAPGTKFTVYFTDAENDTITINASSIPSAFSATINPTNVVISQVTASLDYEATSSYSFTMTVQDQHYTSGDDTTSITSLPVLIQVTDNISPIVNNQTLTAINENSSNGTTVGSITATDSEGDTIVFSNFTLLSAYLNSVGTNVTSSLGGTSLYDPHADPFQCSSGGTVTRKNGVYLNSDVADRYVYLVTISDAYNTTTDTAEITIPIDADASSTIGSDTQTYYIVESAVSGADLTTNTNGYTAGSVTFSSAVSQMWKVNSVPAGYVRFTNGTTQYTGSTSLGLELANNISGSIYTSGSTLQIQITASETSFETTKQYRTHTLKVTPNLAYGVTFSTASYSSNWNTNGARPSNYLAVISFGEYQVGIGDTVNHSTFQLVSSSAGFSRLQSGDNYYIYANSNISAGTYTFSASIADSFGKIGSSSATFTVAQASTGSLTTNGTFYVIETARSGAFIYTSTNGRTGTQGDLGVTYSPQYNSAAVASFTSSNALVSVTTAGALSIGQNVSGSYTSGQTFTSTITFRDQYNNIGSGSITINVAPNSVPTASFTPIAANLTASISANTGLISASISDMETDTPFSMSLGGTNAADLYLVPQNANSSSYVIKNVSTISTGQTLTYDATIKDVHGKTRTYSSNTITIADPVALVYAYGWSGGSAASEATAIASLGDNGADGIAIDSGSVIAMFQSGSLGSTFTPSYIGGACTLYKSSSLTNLSDTSATGLSTLGYLNFSSTSQRVLILFASASNLGGKPASMYDSAPPDPTGTPNEYYVYAKDAAIPGTMGTGIYYFNLQTPHQGYSRWGMIFGEGKNNNNTRYYLMPDSASAP